MMCRSLGSSVDDFNYEAADTMRPTNRNLSLTDTQCSTVERLCVLLKAADNCSISACGNPLSIKGRFFSFRCAYKKATGNW